MCSEVAGEEARNGGRAGPQSSDLTTLSFILKLEEPLKDFKRERDKSRLFNLENSGNYASSGGRLGESWKAY